MYPNIHTLHKLKQCQKTKAFTLLELLVVIFVLGIGILSIVLLISRNLSLTQDLHMRNTATLLAREGIELAFNHRNTNLLLWYERNCAVRATNWSKNTNNSSCSKYYYSKNSNIQNYFIIEGVGKTQVTLSPLNNPQNKSKLYLQKSWTNWPTYTHTSSNTPTPYSRIISFGEMQGLTKNSPITTSDIYTITSKVSFEYGTNKGLKQGEISLESFISNPNP